ncbi:uncharacterized protein LOC119599266, partial [Penaeus monodon]|uniref:uncharacterized protein LOC119599266 n=1 Tax=Penaeus monodon TaxID=6687 RepID=UPI0018A7C4AE
MLVTGMMEADRNILHSYPQGHQKNQETDRRKYKSHASSRHLSMRTVVSAVCLCFLAWLTTVEGCRTGPRIRWRTDGRCGANFPLPSMAPSECDPDSDRPCCSDYGYCGNSLSHCSCPDCIDFRNVIREPSCYYSFEGETGVLESPNFPNQYPPGRECCYD